LTTPKGRVTPGNMFPPFWTPMLEYMLAYML
jgi:hypothetical protein